MLKGIEVIDHGIQYAQYFQGCGVAFTDFTHVATGIGTNSREAIEDAIEQLVMSGIEFDSEDTSYLETEIKLLGPDEAPEDAEEAYYYVSVRVKV
jgi:acetate kinase